MHTHAINKLFMLRLYSVHNRGTVKMQSVNSICSQTPFYKLKICFDLQCCIDILDNSLRLFEMGKTGNNHFSATAAERNRSDKSQEIS